ncbi:aminopeptidase N [Motiliproteus coralliicola]|uniref:Aminopeptidase N n=1 Tax=Motiliproteus coralliicola TaxID=2283196 RepID=A0A369WU96_9GAMM|nr:aminopeptidase N [Motiliproteus coralliicola]RDE25242.1 aminopeptidase N [Motiliproteus coralliicola]
MSKDNPRAIHLKDYRVPPFLIDRTELHFELGEKATLVKSRLSMRRNPDSDEGDAALQLHGDTSLVLRRLQLDGKDLSVSDYQRDDESLTIAQLPDNFVLECVTLIKPQENTSLEGLYKSNGMFCTQCEAEGFRKITFYLDRPDVMSVFTTTIVANRQDYPVLLSNGNPVEQGEQEDGRHWCRWDDPFKKPAYLFALVAGKLEQVDDSFTTQSGREVALRLFVEPQNLDKCDHALASLKRSMAWDEQVYGREYDLDIFMIVAVDHFNMGAMENKGLNIFNSSCVLANPATTTDAGFQRIEGIVGHEYFHNWSGNRVTCRDWFQLSLKEGFTVFRDAEFSADMGSRTVKRIEDVSLLRTAQFAEDAGPMAHPVRPASYIEISNFYTLTVYEKGAEVVRMIHTLLGAEQFRKGSDLYFERHDGQAVTTDDFIQAMEDASGIDLGQFRRWYSQAGTPVVEVSDDYDAEQRRYRLKVRQHCPATPESDSKQPFHIPLAVGLLDEQGNDLDLGDGQTTKILHLTEAEQEFVFEGIDSQPLPSLLRGFSAPVKLRYPYSAEQLVFLMAHDSDGFNRWDAGQRLAVDLMQGLISDYQQGRELVLDRSLVEAYTKVLSDRSLDPAMVAKLLLLPSEAYLAELAEVIDPEAIHLVREFVKRELAQALQGLLMDAYRHNRSEGDYQLNADAIARRSLQNAALSYLMTLEQPRILVLAQHQFASADNMTDQLAALSLIAHSGFESERQQALSEFYQQWQQDPLVVNQWLSVQATSPRDDSLTQVKALMAQPLFDLTNPNRVRALIGAFCGQNAVQFHRADGEGYRFLADQVIALDKLNPQIASRLLTPLTRWKRYDSRRQALMRAQLERIMAGELSKDSYEIVSKSLA